MSPQDEREAIARIVDPVAFKAWQASYDYSIAAGDTVEEATAQADWSQKKACGEALAKADAILALRQPGAEYRRGDQEQWVAKPQEDFLQALTEFRQQLPGWWYSLGECSVTCHASCGPDSKGVDRALLSDKLFDYGFHADLEQPSSLADALRDIMGQGLAARTEALSDSIPDTKGGKDGR